jgi:hypothetical protein
MFLGRLNPPTWTRCGCPQRGVCMQNACNPRQPRISPKLMGQNALMLTSFETVQSQPHHRFNMTSCARDAICNRTDACLICAQPPQASMGVRRGTCHVRSCRHSRWVRPRQPIRQDGQEEHLEAHPRMHLYALAASHPSSR